MLPQDGWLGRLLSPTLGKIIVFDEAAGWFPSRWPDGEIRKAETRPGRFSTDRSPMRDQ
jgi:hypothetical protein